MTWVVHRDSSVRDFCFQLVEGKDSNICMIEEFTLSGMDRVKNGDSIYGTLNMSQLFYIQASFNYVNIVAPKHGKNVWKSWWYFVDHNINKALGEAAIFLKGNETYEVQDGNRNAV